MLSGSIEFGAVWSPGKRNPALMVLPDGALRTLMPGCPVVIELSAVDPVKVPLTNHWIPEPLMVAVSVKEVAHQVVAEESEVTVPLTDFDTARVAEQVPPENVGFWISTR